MLALGYNEYGEFSPNVQHQVLKSFQSHKVVILAMESLDLWL